MRKMTVASARKRAAMNAIKQLEIFTGQNGTSPDSNVENISPPTRRKRKEIVVKQSKASTRKRRENKINNNPNSSSTESDSQSQLSNANGSMEQAKLNDSMSEIEDERSKRLLDATQTPNSSFITDSDGNNSSNRRLRSSRRLMLSAVDANNVETSKSDIENDSAGLDSSVAEFNANEEHKSSSAPVENSEALLPKKMEDEPAAVLRSDTPLGVEDNGEKESKPVNEIMFEEANTNEIKTKDAKGEKIPTQEAAEIEEVQAEKTQTKKPQTENINIEEFSTEKIKTENVEIPEIQPITNGSSYNNESESFQDPKETIPADTLPFNPSTIASVKSPSAVSVDSAKGSSIANESEYGIYATGDIYWGRIHNFSYWACMVCPDDSDDYNLITRLVDQQLEVHVRFFADNARHSWVKRENLIPYQGLESYREHLRELKDKLGAKSLKYQAYLPKRTKLKTWLDAVKEADVLTALPYPERLAKFFALNEVARERNKEERLRRKSMSVWQSTKNLSETNASEVSPNQERTISKKRNRSESPQSPAFSPIRSIKRRKTHADATEFIKNRPAGNVAPDETSSSKPSETEMETDFNTSADSRSSSAKYDTFDSPQFRQFHDMIKDFVMQGLQSEFVEMNLFVAVKNIWALKNILHKHLANSPTVAMSSNSDEKSVKRLSLRIKELQQRQNTDIKSEFATPAATTSQVMTVQKTMSEERRRMSTFPRTKTRPIEEVIDDIFNLDSRYLFDGMSRDPVCKYCNLPGGELRRCSKGCQNWLHMECLNEHEATKVLGTPTRTKASKKRSIKKERDIAAPNVPNAPSPLPAIVLDSASALDVTADKDENYNDNSEALKANEAAYLKALDVIPIQEVNKDPVVCRECAINEAPKCFVCNDSKKQQTSSSGEPIEEQTILCNTMHCNRVYHPSCLKLWPQAKITKSKNTIVSLRCPSHVCHTCVSDDPKGKFLYLSNANTTKCVKCPATYHMDSTCIPAGSEILTAAHIVCPRHATSKNDQNVNVSWCFICVRGGQLICCESCPTAVHAECSNTALDANEGYICDECESGRMPLYGEMVWAKFNAYRWWPAIILPPTEVPLNIRSRAHNRFEFVIRFFGTHDHGWISRRRVYLYLEGDWSEPPRSKRGIDQSYLRGVVEAKQACEIIKAKTLMRVGENENKEKLHPQPYVKIRANRAVAPVRLHQNLEKVGKCECNPDDENPCGPDSNCLNRVLYHECNRKICPAGERCQNQMFEMRVSPALEIFYTKKERGFGLRCREPIPSGTFVIEYVGEVIDSVEFQRRMQQKSNDRDENYYFLYVEKDYIIDAGPKGNMARFMNHSCNPNCETQKWSVNGLNRVGLFAIRDIPADTELTFNYHWDELLGNDKKACYCCAENCTGQIGKVSKDVKTKQPSLDEPPSGLNAKSSKSEQTKSQKIRKRRKNSTFKLNQNRSKNDEEMTEKSRTGRRKKKAVHSAIDPTETASAPDPAELNRSDGIEENPA